MTETNRRFMNEKSVLNALTSTLILAAGARSLPACANGTALSGSRGQNPRRVKRMVAGTRESARRRPERSVDLIDDVGYGAAGTFGGLIQTPTFDSLANNGLALYQLPYLRHLRPDPLGAADRPQQRIGA
jgi:hypothetical protein